MDSGLNVVMPSIRLNTGVTVHMATRNDEVREADSNDTLYRNQEYRLDGIESS